MNNDTILNEFCLDLEDKFILEPTSTELKLATLILAITILFATGISFFYFLKHRHHYIMLQKRNIYLLAFNALSILLLTIGGSYRILQGADRFSCRTLIIIFATTFFLFVDSGLVRLLSLFWRIQFNQSLINETYLALVGGELNISVGGEDFVKKKENEGNTKLQKNYYSPILDEMNQNEVKDTVLPFIGDRLYALGVKISPWLFFIFRWHPSEDLPKNLQFAQFLASQYVAIVLAVLFSILLIGISIGEAFRTLPIGEDCDGCPIESIFAYAPIYLIGIDAVFYFYTLFRLRKVPDTLGIKEELLVIGLVFVLANILTIGLLRAYKPELEEEGQFDFSLVSFIVGLFLMIYMFPFQVWKAKQKFKETIDVEETLKELLGSKEGKKAFSLYLASNLSLETLMFYEAANTWKSQYSGMTEQQINKSAKALYDQYIGSEAFMLINISSGCRSSIEEGFIEEIRDASLFDRAAGEMFSLMSTDIFPRFIKSSYYKAYTNEFQE